jgi:hypothetical protein
MGCGEVVVESGEAIAVAEVLYRIGRISGDGRYVLASRKRTETGCCYIWKARWTESLTFRCE